MEVRTKISVKVVLTAHLLTLVREVILQVKINIKSINVMKRNILHEIYLDYKV